MPNSSSRSTTCEAMFSWFGRPSYSCPSITPASSTNTWNCCTRVSSTMRASSAAAMLPPRSALNSVRVMGMMRVVGCSVMGSSLSVGAVGAMCPLATVVKPESRPYGYFVCQVVIFHGLDVHGQVEPDAGHPHRPGVGPGIRILHKGRVGPLVSPVAHEHAPLVPEPPDSHYVEHSGHVGAVHTLGDSRADGGCHDSSSTSAWLPHRPSNPSPSNGSFEQPSTRQCAEHWHVSHPKTTRAACATARG